MSFGVVVPPIFGGGVVEKETQRGSDRKQRERERGEIDSFILFYYIIYFILIVVCKTKNQDV